MNHNTYILRSNGIHLDSKQPAAGTLANNSTTDEKGVVLLEWALVCFGLFVGLLLFYDISQVLVRYMMLTQAAYEGVRITSDIPDLEAGEGRDILLTANQTTDCENFAVVTGVLCGHALAQARIRKLIESMKVFDTQVSGLGPKSIVTRYSPTTVASDENSDSVYVNLTSVYNGYILNNFTLRTNAQGAYLFEPTT